MNAPLVIEIVANLDKMRAALASDLAPVLASTKASMAAMSTAFDGSRVISNANAAMAAIQSMGGITTLTANEQAKLNTLLTTGLEKYEALGRAAPPGMQSLADSTKRVADTTQQASGILEGFVGQYIEARALFDVGRQVVEAFGGFIEGAKQIQDLAARTGIATDELQRLQYAAELSGTSIETVARSMGQLQNRLEGGNQQALDALDKLNLSYDDLKALDPGQEFEDIAVAIGAIQDPAERTRVAMELFGRSGTELLPLMRSNLKDIGDQAFVMSGQQIDALSNLEETWIHIKNAGGALLEGTLRPLTDTVTEMSHEWAGFRDSLGLGTIGNEWQKWRDNIEWVLVHMPGGGGAPKAMADAGMPALPPAPAGFLPAPIQLPQLPTGADLKQYYKDLDEQMKAFNADQKLAAQLAKQYADALQKVGDTINGLALQKTVSLWDTEITKLGGSTMLSNAQLAIAGTEAAKLRDAGGTLTPQLAALANVHDLLSSMVAHTAADLRGESAAFKDAQKAASDYIAHLPTANLGDSGIYGISLPNLPKIDGSFFDGIQTREDDLTKGADNWDAALKNAGRSVQTLGTDVGGVFGTIIKDLGDMGKDTAAATKSFGAMHDAFKAGDTSSGIMDAVSGVAGLASAATVAEKAVVSLWNHFFGDAGRDAVIAFANTQGGFDALHKELTDSLTNGVGEQFWIQLTQEVGKNDVAGANAIVAKIQAALANAPDALAAAAGYQTIDQLQGVADKAKEVYDYMVSSGKYTASEIADAFAKMGDAQKATFSSSSQAMIDAANAGATASKKIVDGLTSQIQSLQQSVDQEAPEEVMGIIEANQRAQIASLQKQQKDAQTQLDTWNQQIQDATSAAVLAAQGAAEAAGKNTVDQIQKALDNNTFYVKVNVDTGGSGDSSIPHHGTGGYFDTPHIAVIGDRPEYITPRSSVSELAREIAAAGGLSGAGSGGGGGDQINVYVTIDPETGDVKNQRIERVAKRMAASGALKTRSGTGRNY